MSFYEDASLIVLADGAYDSGIKAFKPVLNDNDPSDPDYLVPSGVGDFTVDRNSVATRVNADGLIEEVGFNVPRLDYLNGSCPELLVEPQSTNLYDYSEDLNLWQDGLVGLSISADSSISPDGTVNADLITEDTSTGSHVIRDTSGPTITATNDYSFSFFVKSNGRNIVGLSNSVGTASATAFFDLSTGVVLSSTFDYESIVNYGNGWWRVSTTHEATGTGDYEARIYTSIADGSFSHTGDGSSGLYVWGLQVEQLEYPTSYIKKEGLTVTRLADEITGAGDSSTFNSSEGVLYAEISALANDAGTERYIYLGDGSTDNRVVIRFSPTENDIRMLVSYNGSTQVSQGTTNYNVTNLNKIALKYKQNDFALWINGTEVLIDTNGNSPIGLNVLNLSYGNTNFYGRVKQILVFNEALSDAELTSLTS